LKGITDVLDLINEYAGRITSVIIYALLIVVIYEVISRKVFNAPTVWAFDLSFMLYSTMFLLGGGYTLKYKGHIFSLFLSFCWDSGICLRRLCTAVMG